MVHEIPMIDLSKGQAGVLQGNDDDSLWNNQSVMLDPRTGKEYPPGERFGNLPRSGVVQLPRTTWYETAAGATAPAILCSRFPRPS